MEGERGMESSFLTLSFADKGDMAGGLKTLQGEVRRGTRRMGLRMKLVKLSISAEKGRHAISEALDRS